MKKFLTSSQTQFLKELGWPQPEAENYSIGELILWESYMTAYKSN